MTTTIKQTAEVTLRIAIMKAAELHAIAADGINADKKLATAHGAHGKTYAALSARLRTGIASGLVSTDAFTEYRRRVTAFANEVAAARMADYEGEDKAEATARHVAAINKGIDRDNKKAAWVSPRAAKSEEVKEVEARKREADKKAAQRATKKVLAQLKKEKPQADEADLLTIAKEHVKATTKEQRDEQRETAKYVANEARYIEKLAAFNADMPEVFQADVREVQKRLAVVIMELQALRTK
jgi:hypothetical protein